MSPNEASYGPNWQSGAVEAASPLEGVAFASDAAREAAEGTLVAEDFDGREPSGVTGFTKRDVEALTQE